MVEPITDDQGARLGIPPVVAPQLEPLLVDIWSVKPHPRNVRRGNVDAIAKSLAAHGQQKPIVVQESTGFIVAGNHVYQAAHRLGWGKIAASVVPLDDDKAWRYLLDDNRASDLATYDRDTTIAALEALSGEGKLEDTLWTVDDLDDLYASGNVTTAFQEFEGGYGISEEEIAERQAAQKERTASTIKMKEVPVVLSTEDHKQFMLMLSRLQKEYGTDGRIATIVEAVRREWNRVIQEKGNDVEADRAVDLAAAATEIFMAERLPVPDENAPVPGQVEMFQEPE